MAITLDSIAAGFQVPKAIAKTGITMAAAGAMRGYTPWYANGNPGAASANAAGINGAAVSGVVAGSLPRTNPASGNAYLGRLSMTASAPGVLWLIDRLWHNSGLSVTSTTAQAITPATLPARDANKTTQGAQVMAAMEWSGAGGAGTPTVTLTYTDQDGNTGASATLTAVASPPIGTFEIFALGAGDTGIRAPTSLIQSGTRTSGTMHLVLFRVLAQMECSAANIGNSIDAITGGMPEILDNSTLQLVWFPNGTTTTNFIGTYTETHVVP
jgi:hypothetical protein